MTTEWGTRDEVGVPTNRMGDTKPNGGHGMKLGSLNFLYLRNWFFRSGSGGDLTRRVAHAGLVSPVGSREGAVGADRQPILGCQDKF